MSAEALPLTSVGIIILVAILLSIIARKIGQNAVIGFIIAGFLLGPIGFNLLSPTDELVIAFGEMGLFVLLFYLGVELSLKDFLKHGATNCGMALLGMAGLIGFGFLFMMFLGFSSLFAIVVGIMLFCTSTAVVAEFIFEKKLVKSNAAKLALSVLILQDFLGIMLLVFITSMSAKGSTLGMALTALVFASATFYAVHKLSRMVEDWFENNDFGHTEMTLYALGVGLLVSTLGSFLGLSTAIGAYFAGFALSETRAGYKIKKDLNFLRDFFLVFFFVGFGTTIFYDHNLGQAVFPAFEQLLFLLGLTLVLTIGILLMNGVIFNLFGALFGLNRDDSTDAAILLTPLGEFVVIIATFVTPVLIATEAKVIGPLAFMIILATVLVFQPVYNNRKIHKTVFSFVPKFFVQPKTKTQLKPHTEYTEKLIKKIAYNAFIVLCLAWVTVLLYRELPDFGVPIQYSRQISTIIIFSFFAAVPFLKAVSGFRELFSHLKIVPMKPILKKKKK